MLIDLCMSPIYDKHTGILTNAYITIHIHTQPDTNPYWDTHTLTHMIGGRCTGP